MSAPLRRRAFLLAGAAPIFLRPAVAAAPPTRHSSGALARRGSRFVVGTDRGAITSLRCRGDRFDTDYVRAGATLGDVVARIRAAGAAGWRKVSTRKGAPIATGLSATGRSAAAEGVILSSRLTLDDTALVWTIEVVNGGTGAVEVGDLLFALPMHTRFEANRPATEAVMKHSFVSGHGSHIFWMRSNSAGPYLLLLPERDTHLEYWESRPGEDGKDVYCAFIHAGAAMADNAVAGARWRLPVSTLRLAPGERRRYGFRFVWVDDYAAARAAIAAAGLVDVEVVPGMTVPSDLHADIALRSAEPVARLEAEHPADTTLERLPDRDGRQLWRIRFRRLGENRLTVHQPGGRRTELEFFASEPLETMMKKRAAFIVRRQHRDPSKWYDGLFGEWNMETGVLLGPDNYDRIKGWRIYEVTCDDPGLGKPAYLAGKNAHHPVAEEVAALDHYIGRFVWGGLQMTTAERYPYAIYGIPDWKQNRDSTDPGDKGRLHIWRPYDYPHIFAMYHAMHRVARDHPHIPTRLTARAYLTRAWGTAVAMFTVPKAVVGWSAEETGFYNECVIPEIVADLRDAGMTAEADTLEGHWFGKVRRFASGAVDLFGSEYPFDSTGFESTQALARTALDTPVRAGVTAAAAKDFSARQIAANLFCRGWLEPAYYLLGSDYRAGGGDGYTLSYMAQMGGWAVLDHALYDAADPYPLLRLGYASQLSAWALLNSGTPESGHGYWYPGEPNDGGAGGGFEPASHGETWLEQPHHRGSWYYSCEIDLGFGGALRAAATIVADDPVFGRICYGGRMEPDAAGATVFVPADGIRRRLHVRLGETALDLRLDNARFAAGRPVVVDAAIATVRFEIEPLDPGAASVRLAMRGADGMWAKHERPMAAGRVSIARGPGGAWQ